MAAVLGGVVVLRALAAATLSGRGAYATVVHPSENMEPSVHVGDAVVLAKKLPPARGDVVRAEIRPGGTKVSTLLRVVALAGDTVACSVRPERAVHRSHA